MAIQTPATTKMVQNIIDGTTVPQKALSADTAANVSQQINGKAITNIFESDGLKVKNATLADNAANVTANINGKAIASIFESDGITAKTASKLGTASVGTASKPIYLSSGVPSAIQYTLNAACAKAVSDSTAAGALSSTDTNVPTVRDIYYGTPTINGSKGYTSNTNIFAPTSVGSKGSLLVSNGSGEPSWDRDFLSRRASLYYSTSISTGNKTTTLSINNYGTIFISIKVGSSHYPFWVPREEFAGRNNSNNTLGLTANTASSDKYINIYYVNSTTFNITNFLNIDALEIFGVA